MQKTTTGRRTADNTGNGVAGDTGRTLLFIPALPPSDVLADLHAQGYAAAEARNGSDAAARLNAAASTQDYAAVIIDIDSLTEPVLHRLREATPGIPLVVAAGIERIDDALAATRHGADMHIRKPLHSGEIGHLLQRNRDELRLKSTLAHSEENYRTLIDVSPEAILIHCAGNIVFANPAACDLLAASTRDLVGRSILDIVHPDFHDVASGRMRDVLTGSRVELSEQRLVRKDGKAIPVEVISAKIIWRGVPGIQAIIRDISDRKRSRQALRLRARIIDQINDCVLTAALDGRITGWNEGAARMFGYSREQVIGQYIDIILPEKKRDQLQSRLIAPLLADGALEREIKAQRATGDSFDAFMSLSVLRDDSETPIGLIGYIRDISERKRAEAKLIASEQRLRSVVETAVDGIVVSDGQGIIQFVNKAVEAIFGYPAESLIGKNVAVLMPEPFRSQHDGFIETFVETGVSRVIGRGRDLVGMRADGSTFPISVSLSSWMENGERRFTTLLRDITQRVETQKALEAARDRAESADRAKTMFLAHMSHELRTPLNAVIGYSEMIMNQVLGPITPPRYIDYARDIHASGTHLLKILTDILDMSLAVSGELTLDESETDVGDLIRACLQTFEHSRAAGTESITLQTEIESPLPHLRVDGQRLSQAILSLLDNAARHTPADGRIVISARRLDDGGIRLSISDNGPGIPAERIPVLFTPFGSAQRAYIRSDGGLGLGLPLVKSLIELHDGEIWLDSVPGEGTRVHLRLPPARLVA